MSGHQDTTTRSMDGAYWPQCSCGWKDADSGYVWEQGEARARWEVHAERSPSDADEMLAAIERLAEEHGWMTHTDHASRHMLTVILLQKERR